MTYNNRSPFNDQGHALVIGPSRTGKTCIPLLRREGVPFEWKQTPGTHHHRVWAPAGEGMSCADDRSGEQAR